jgi:hypothetical protein
VGVRGPGGGEGIKSYIIDVHGNLNTQSYVDKIFDPIGSICIDGLRQGSSILTVMIMLVHMWYTSLNN